MSRGDEAGKNNSGFVDIISGRDISSPDDLFYAYYALAESPKYFLFKQNARKTNIQFVELCSLLRLHTKKSGGFRSRPASIQFVSLTEVRRFIANIYPQIASGGVGKIRAIQELIDYLEGRIAVDFRYGSAIVRVPIQFQIDLECISSESGFVHSCGDLVYHKRMSEVDEANVTKSLDLYIELFSSPESKYLIVPYCHEDFSAVDREASLFLVDGLDDVKIHISKVFIGESSLHVFLDNYANQNDDKVCLAPSDYKLSRTKFREKFPDFDMVTLWIIADAKLTPGSRFPGDEKYLTIYRQRYKNENPYHNYEENKPAWVSHTTLPHSLAGAMINVARPWMVGDGLFDICDPFGGSGTIYLESQNHPTLNCFTSDKAYLAEFIIQDNIRFFRLSRSELESLIRDLDTFEDLDKLLSDTKSKRVAKHRRTVLNVLKTILDWRRICDFDFLTLGKADVDNGMKSVGDGLLERILLYIALRATIRGRVERERAVSTWTDNYRREFSTLLTQMKNHLKSDSVNPDSSSVPTASRLAMGDYSAVVVPPAPAAERVDLFGSRQFTIASVENIDRNKYDAIVCDPPYGFNTKTEVWESASFSRMFIQAVVLALKPTGGQLVIALPRQSFSGREIPFFLRSDFVSREIVRFCWENERECTRPAVVLPETVSADFQPPYYWVAEKTLERRILHFWIRKRY